jgi:hypothetical protein
MAKNSDVPWWFILGGIGAAAIGIGAAVAAAKPTPQLYRCHNCNTTVEEGTNFCPRCGVGFAWRGVGRST